MNSKMTRRTNHGNPERQVKIKYLFLVAIQNVDFLSTPDESIQMTVSCYRAFL